MNLNLNLKFLALMSMLPLSLNLIPGHEPESAPRERVLADFSKSPSAVAWRAVNDNVMGGRSTGGSTLESGVLVFEGETRLQNNGGFSSIRSDRRDWKLDGAREIVLRVRGTAARKYTMIMETRARSWGMPVSYWQPFKLEGDGWQTVSLPLVDFKPTLRGRKLRSPQLDDGQIRSLGFMVYDKKAGPFRLEIDSIKARWSEAETASPTPSPSPSTTTSGDKPNIVELASGAGSFKTLLAAAEAAGLVETLTGPGPFTVLAPTDDAFAALPNGTLESLLKPEGKDQLRAILLYHVIPGALAGGKLAVAGTATTAQGQDLTFALTSGRLTVNGANVVLNDLEASNGLVHAIDRVLLPKPEPSAAQRLIEKAVKKGAPLFNDGHFDACAAIYEITINAMLELDAAGLDEQARKTLSSAVAAASSDEDYKSAAWTMRRAMDVVWNRISR